MVLRFCFNRASFVMKLNFLGVLIEQIFMRVTFWGSRLFLCDVRNIYQIIRGGNEKMATIWWENSHWFNH